MKVCKELRPEHCDHCSFLSLAYWRLMHTNLLPAAAAEAAGQK